MADIEKGLPIRTEDDPQNKVQVKVVDFTTPTQGQQVDTDGNAHTKVHGTDPAAADQTLKLSETGRANPDGDYDGTSNTKPASSALIAHDRDAAPDETDQNKRVTAVAGADDTVCLDVAIRDEAGAAFSATNPMPTYQVDDLPGAEVHDEDTAVDVAADQAAAANHDHSVADGDTFHLKSVLCSASGRGRFQVQVGDGAASEAFVPLATKFVTESHPNADFIFDPPKKFVGTVDTTTVRVVKLNRDDDDVQDMFSTIIGVTTS